MEKTHTRLTVIGTKQLGQVPGSALEAMSCLSILIFSWLGIFGSQGIHGCEHQLLEKVPRKWPVEICFLNRCFGY